LSPGGNMSQSLTERYDDRIAGMLSCYDRFDPRREHSLVPTANSHSGNLHRIGLQTRS
jgi:hypothetical protein